MHENQSQVRTIINCVCVVYNKSLPSLTIAEFSFALDTEILNVEKEGRRTYDLYLRRSPMVNEVWVFNLTVKGLFNEK